MKSSQQITNAFSPGPFGFKYTAQGGLSSVRYPSGTTLTYAFDSTAGRVQSVSGTANYASALACWPNGAVRQMNLGNNLTEQTCLNSRFQSTGIRLGGAAATINCGNSGSDSLNLGYFYPGANNNGNPLSQTIQRPGASWTQNYLRRGEPPAIGE